VKNDLLQAMAIFRGVRDVGQKYCKNGQYAGANPSAYNDRLYAAEYSLIGAMYKTMDTFDSSIFQKTQIFLDQDSDVDRFNVCSKSAVSNKKLRELEHVTNIEMMRSIQNLREEKRRIEN
jgi:hypothetical protein